MVTNNSEHKASQVELPFGVSMCKGKFEYFDTSSTSQKYPASPSALPTTICKHELTYKNLCCQCGEDMTAEQSQVSSKIPSPTSRSKSPNISLDWMLGTCPADYHGLRATNSVLKNLYVNDYKSLIQQKKLRLVLDFDETLVHTVQYPLSPSKKNNEQEQILVFQDSMEIQYDESAAEQNELLAQAVGLHHPPQHHIKTPKKQKLPGIDVNDEAEYISFTLRDSLFKVYIRPQLREFLRQLTKCFDVYIYTHGTDRYARTVLQMLFPQEEGIQISGIFARQSGSSRSLKQLHKMLCKRATSIIVDDRVDVWCKSDEGNVIQISPFYGSSKDTELSFLATYLLQIHNFYYTQQEQQDSIVDVREVLHHFSQSDLQGILSLDLNYEQLDFSAINPQDLFSCVSV